MVQMKVTAAALIAAAAIVPAVASSFYADDSLPTREDYNDVDDLLAREYELELEERDFYDNGDALFERDPFFRNFLRKWRTKKTMQQQQPQQPLDTSSDPSLATREFDDEDLFTRELEDMFERDPFLGFKTLKKWWKNRKAAKQQQQDPQADASLDSREFDEDDLFTRELEEMFERDPFMGFGTLKKWWKNRKAAKQQQQQDSSSDLDLREFDDEELYTREFEDDMEIEARAPEADYEEVLARYFDDLYERELASAEAELAERDFEDEEAEIAARDFEGDEAELVSREPGFFDFFTNLFHKKKPAPAKAKAEKADAADAKADKADSADAEAREFEDFDDLD